MMPPFQTRVAAFTKAHQLEHDPATRLLDLVSETGEVAKEMLKATQYGAQAFSSADAWRDEMGDVFFALVCLANETGVNLETALQLAIAKYEHRLAQNGSAESANNL
jgi:NTP pyrophosphatase (non-canonical NTP hydrolase)